MSQESDLQFFARRIGLPGPYREELRELGKRRRAALAEAQAVLNQVEELLPEALHAGLSLSEIARLSAVSRPTLYGLKRRGRPPRRRLGSPEQERALADAARDLGIDTNSTRVR